MTRAANTLEEQLEEARRTISSEGYPMSIGELTNMYRQGELIVRPEFQRFFRWSRLQKSRLIESVLLGIPIPSIFVAQTKDGRWELIDGLQRISTLLELQGELRASTARQTGSFTSTITDTSPLVLQGTKYLPALEGRMWDSGDPATSLTEAQRLDIKRSKIDLKIIKRESSAETKYDLFQRLNNYGTPLSSAELRSSLLVAVSADFFSSLEELARHESFLDCLQLSERLVEERYDLELVTRFLVLHNRPTYELTASRLRDLPQVLDDESVVLAGRPSNELGTLGRIFRRTFDFIAENGGANVFRKWDTKRQEFRGSFLNTSFEIFGLGVGYHIASRSKLTENLLRTVQIFWSTPNMQSGFATGRSTESRMAEFIPLGRKLTGNVKTALESLKSYGLAHRTGYFPMNKEEYSPDTD